MAVAVADLLEYGAPMSAAPTSQETLPGRVKAI